MASCVLSCCCRCCSTRTRPTSSGGGRCARTFYYDIHQRVTDHERNDDVTQFLVDSSRELSDVNLPCQEPPSSEFPANKTEQKTLIK